MGRKNPFHLLRDLFDFLGENRFTLLLVSLLLTIGLGEVLAEFRMSWGLEILILINLILLLSVFLRQGHFRAGFILFALSLISRGLAAATGLRFLNPGSETCAAALLILGTVTCFQSAFGSGRKVDRERISASLSLYLMFGLIFALLFALVDKLLPGSFQYPSSLANDPSAKPLTQLIYFSYVTLATLGYGDIVPLSGPAKGLAILEAIIGQLYLVLVVARLVSLYSQSDSD
ncbi:MAG TPA: potassium channel family protein [Thermodesulfobacteriota bacterium]|nr:potassium channel family protein [Thermodesulfobacteriota bacterium]